MLAEAMANLGIRTLGDLPPDGKKYWASRFWDWKEAEQHPNPRRTLPAREAGPHPAHRGACGRCDAGVAVLLRHRRVRRAGVASDQRQGGRRGRHLRARVGEGGRAGPARQPAPGAGRLLGRRARPRHRRPGVVRRLAAAPGQHRSGARPAALVRRTGGPVHRERLDPRSLPRAGAAPVRTTPARRQKHQILRQRRPDQSLGRSAAQRPLPHQVGALQRDRARGSARRSPRCSRSPTTDTTARSSAAPDRRCWWAGAHVPRRTRWPNSSSSYPTHPSGTSTPHCPWCGS